MKEIGWLFTAGLYRACSLGILLFGIRTKEFDIVSPIVICLLASLYWTLAGVAERKAYEEEVKEKAK